MSKARISVYRKGVAAVALSAALAGAFVATGPLGTLQDARAEAVRVTPPQQAGGCAALCVGGTGRLCSRAVVAHAAA